MEERKDGLLEKANIGGGKITLGTSMLKGNKLRPWVARRKKDEGGGACVVEKRWPARVEGKTRISGRSRSPTRRSFKREEKVVPLEQV